MNSQILLQFVLQNCFKLSGSIAEQISNFHDEIQQSVDQTAEYVSVPKRVENPLFIILTKHEGLYYRLQNRSLLHGPEGVLYTIRRDREMTVFACMLGTK